MGLDKRAEQIAKEAGNHSWSVHGDRDMHKNCDICQEFVRSIIAANGLSVEDIRTGLASGKLPADHPGAAVFRKMFSNTSEWD